MSRGSNPTLRVHDRLIGGSAPTFIVAEAGVNHDGDAGAARELIAAAAEAGADAVKFQVFSADRLVTRAAAAAAYQKQAVQAETQHQMLRKLELAHAVFAELRELCLDKGIEFLATPFSIPDLKFLVGIGARVLKLASPDIVNTPLLRVAAASELPVIASTGAADLEEVAEAVDLFQGCGGGPLALLHCVSSYPTPKSEANLSAIGTLARAFGCVSGFSDHTESLTIGGLAVAAGARIIEKHLTLDRRRIGPDHSFSLEPAQFAEYIRHIRTAEVLMGNGVVAPSPIQREVRHLARSSVVAACDIPAGAILTREMLTCKRPGGGIAPAELEALIGRQVAQAIPADTLLAHEKLAAEVVGV